MARILIVTSGIASVYLPNLELARRLCLLGHEVGYASQDPIRTVVERQGLPFIQLKGEAPHRERRYYRPGSKLNKLIQLAGKLFTIRQRRQQALADFEIEHFLREAKAFEADLFIVDVELHAHIMASYTLGKPILLSSIWMSLFKHDNVPPLHMYLRPDEDSEEAWSAFRRWKQRQRLWEMVRTVGEDQGSLFRALGERLGFPVAEELDPDQWLLPFTYRTLPVITLTSLALDFPRDAAGTETHLGPVILQDRENGKLTREDREQLDALLKRPSPGKERRLVYCAFGAQYQGDDSVFFNRVLTAANKLPQYDFIIGLGGRVAPEAFPEVASHVYLLGWVPQLEVLQVADAAVMHAGISSLNECVYFGVPMLMYPFWDIVDQSGNAARFEYHNLGLCADRRLDSAADIARKVDRLLVDKRIRDSVKEMQRHLHKEEVGRKFESLIESLLLDS